MWGFLTKVIPKKIHKVKHFKKKHLLQYFVFQSYLNVMSPFQYDQVQQEKLCKHWNWKKKKTPKEDFQKNALDMISYECS